MARFEEGLLEQLKQHEPDPGVALPARRRLTPVATVAAAAVVAALVAVVLPSLGGTAHAVTKNPDGTVTISWKDLGDVDAANKELRDLGVTNIVIVTLSDPGRCAPDDLVSGHRMTGGPPDLFTSSDEPEAFTTIRQHLIPPDRTVVVIHGGDWDAVGLYPTQEGYCVEKYGVYDGTATPTAPPASSVAPPASSVAPPASSVAPPASSVAPPPSG